MEGEKSILKDKKFLTSLSIAIGVILVLVLIVVGAMSMFGGSKKLSLAKAQEVASKYIDETLLQGQIKAKLSDFKAFNSDLFVFKVEVQGQTYDSYITKDGKWLFPQAYEIKPATSTATTTAQVGTETQQPTAKPVSKNDKPVVELFVMSYCPYGTQAEKGILPAVKALGNKIDFKLKFVAYTMHGDKETQENLLQYCINK
ncbi:MAG: hypothetical protein WCL61_02435, partial [bacterium]